MPFTMPAIAGIPATGIWTIILLVYAFIASVLPVTTLLQPRDFINAHELIVAMVLLVGGVFVSAIRVEMPIVAPMVDINPADAPPMWPFLFITIACGAISGFHALVSSGTTSKQVANETDSLPVGYGGMLMEGVLSTLVVIATVAGIGLAYNVNGETLTGVAAWTEHYASWAAAGGLGDKVGAFVIGSANMINELGIPRSWAIAIMGVFVASFAGTSLDTATRIQRYVVAELFSRMRIRVFQNIFIGTTFAVVTALLLAFSTGADGKGALQLWPMFGAINQSLAALALIIITIYLKTRGGRRWMISLFPAIFMIIMTLWATVLNQVKFIEKDNMLLVVINLIILLVVVTIAFEGGLKLFKLFSERKSGAEEQAA
jgi:carbon starvation protein